MQLNRRHTLKAAAGALIAFVTGGRFASANQSPVATDRKLIAMMRRLSCEGVTNFTVNDSLHNRLLQIIREQDGNLGVDLYSFRNDAKMYFRGREIFKQQVNLVT